MQLMRRMTVQQEELQQINEQLNLSQYGFIPIAMAAAPQTSSSAPVTPAAAVAVSPQQILEQPIAPAAAVAVSPQQILGQPIAPAAAVAVSPQQILGQPIALSSLAGSSSSIAMPVVTQQLPMVTQQLPAAVVTQQLPVAVVTQQQQLIAPHQQQILVSSGSFLTSSSAVPSSVVTGPAATSGQQGDRSQRILYTSITSNPANMNNIQ